MPSPTCTVDAGSTTNGVDVADNGGTCTIQLTDLSASEWAISIVGQDDAVTAPTLAVNYVTKTATFTKPAGPWALIFQSKVNNGLDANFEADPTLTTTFAIYVKTATHTLRLVAANERAEGSALYGWVKQVNAAIKTADAAGGGSGTASWLDGTDTAYTVAAATGLQNVRIPALTASRTWTLSNATAGDGMRVKLCDAGYSTSAAGHYTTAAGSGYAITVSGFAGTEHIYAEGKDQGTTYAVPAALLGNGSVAFEYRASDSTWSLA